MKHARICGHVQSFDTLSVDIGDFLLGLSGCLAGPTCKGLVLIVPKHNHLSLTLVGFKMLSVGFKLSGKLVQVAAGWQLPWYLLDPEMTPSLPCIPLDILDSRSPFFYCRSNLRIVNRVVPFFTKRSPDNGSI